MGLLDVVLVLLGSYDSPVAVTATALYADGWEAQATVTDKIRSICGHTADFAPKGAILEKH